MATFLLWNINRKPLDDLVLNLVRQFWVDVVLLVEYPLGVSRLPGLLRGDGVYKRRSSDRFGVFVRQPHRLARLPPRLGRRVESWKWLPDSGAEGLLVLLHGPDRRNYGESARRLFFRRVARAIRVREGKLRHRRTVVAGDFNAHPFDSAIRDADGLHAVGTRAGATAASFYNPMWRAYGHADHADAGAATYYWRRSAGHESGWFMLDQVVLRPDEVGGFPEDRLRIVTQVGEVSLLDGDGRPDPRAASDHLPIVFEWNL